MSNMYYSYDPVTFEFVSEIVPEESPIDAEIRHRRNFEIRQKLIAEWQLEGGEGEAPDTTHKEEQASVFLVPAFCTDVTPPVFNMGERPVYDVVNRTWRIVEDNRNVKLYCVHTGELKSGFNLGDKLVETEDTTLVSPPQFDQGQLAYFKDGVWAVTKDIRGQTAYNKQSGEPEPVTQVKYGKEPEELTLEVPPINSIWDHIKAKWVVDAAKQQQYDRWLDLNELNNIDKKKIRVLTDMMLGDDKTKAEAKQRLIDLEKLSEALRRKT